MFDMFTYSDLKKKSSREEIKECLFSSIGTQSGGFGEFKEEFRVISKLGSESVKSELEFTASLIGVTYDELMESMPELKKLIA